MAELLHELILASASRSPAAVAVRQNGEELDYAALAQSVERAADGLLALGVQARERVAVWLDKRFDTVSALFGAALLPVNPLLRAEQAGFILRDCDARGLLTTPERFGALSKVLAACPNLRTVVLCGAAAGAAVPGLQVLGWDDCMRGQGARARHRCIESDMAAVLYTSGSCGQPNHAALQVGEHGCGALTLAALPGGFVFAILDERRGEALLAVDRSGGRPLFYQPVGRTLIFATSAEALVQHPGAGREIDPQVLYDYLYVHGVPAPAAIYNGQRRLLPGEFLHFQGGRLQKERYWKIHFHEAGVAGGLESKRELLDTLRDASEAALGGQRGGVLLSGGPGSAAIAALPADAPVRSYAVGYGQ